MARGPGKTKGIPQTTGVHFYRRYPSQSKFDVQASHDRVTSPSAAKAELVDDALSQRLIHDPADTSTSTSTYLRHYQKIYY